MYEKIMDFRERVCAPQMNAMHRDIQDIKRVVCSSEDGPPLTERMNKMEEKLEAIDKVEVVNAVRNLRRLNKWVIGILSVVVGALLVKYLSAYIPALSVIVGGPGLVFGILPALLFPAYGLSLYLYNRDNNTGL